MIWLGKKFLRTITWKSPETREIDNFHIWRAHTAKSWLKNGQLKNSCLKGGYKKEVIKRDRRRLVRQRNYKTASSWRPRRGKFYEELDGNNVKFDRERKEANTSDNDELTVFLCQYIMAKELTDKTGKISHTDYSPRVWQWRKETGAIIVSYNSQGRTFFILHSGETQIYSVWVNKGQQKGLVLYTSVDCVLIEEGSTKDWKEWNQKNM